MMRFSIPVSALILILSVTVFPGCATTSSQSNDLQVHTSSLLAELRIHDLPFYRLILTDSFTNFGME